MGGDDFVKQLYPSMSAEDKATLDEIFRGSGNVEKALGILQSAKVAPGQDKKHQRVLSFFEQAWSHRGVQHHSANSSGVQSKSRNQDEFQPPSEHNSNDLQQRSRPSS
ncbi:hypothetical protein V6N13_069854 [Hibiscus sabdariffa]|uniref:CUE domain-containing protein n=1 Tax=Hibiscus sabdariffa TaxID=183260 RepID=A0ABR2BIT4_9ROSI